jgi:hypothetical protein
VLAGESRSGYYSYDLGSWHLISLNSEIDMDAGSPQEQWLRADLVASYLLDMRPIARLTREEGHSNRARGATS